MSSVIFNNCKFNFQVLNWMVLAKFFKKYVYYITSMKYHILIEKHGTMPLQIFPLEDQINSKMDGSTQHLYFTHGAPPPSPIFPPTSAEI